MLLVGFIGWWYGAGWLTLVRRVGAASQHILRFFSVGELAGSLFAPFRQISAMPTGGPLGVQLRAFVDKLVSRFIGAIVRSMLIVFGLVAATVYGAFGVVAMVAWPLMPLLPVIGLALAMTGYKL